MKPYGIPRHPYLESIDAADQVYFAIKPSRCNLVINGDGDRHNSVRSSKVKRASRRVFKRMARNENRNIIRSQMDD